MKRPLTLVLILTALTLFSGAARASMTLPAMTPAGSPADGCFSDRALPEDIPGQAYVPDAFDAGLAFLEAGEPGRAMREFTRAVRLNAADWEALDERGMLFLELGYPERALKDINQAISLKAGDACLHVDRAIVYEALGDRKAAVAEYDAALSLRPDLDIARENRAALLDGR